MQNDINLPAETAPVPATTNQAPAPGSLFAGENQFEFAQRAAKLLMASTMLPPQFKALPDAVLLLEISSRLGISPFVCAQNLNFVHNRPCWSAAFIIGMVNASGRFVGPLRFRLDGEGDDHGCTAWATLPGGEVVEGPRITIGAAKREGWYSRAGSKWPTLSTLMLTYRSAAFFARTYCPDLLLGLTTIDEAHDIGATDQGSQAAAVEALLVEDDQ